MDKNNLSPEDISIEARGLSPAEATGQTGRTDFHLLNGKEVFLQAEYKDSAGQAFTDSPSSFRGTLAEILG